jgi:hypothetical protein
MISYTKKAHANELIDKEEKQSKPDWNFIKYLKAKFNL